MTASDIFSATNKNLMIMMMISEKVNENLKQARREMG